MGFRYREIADIIRDRLETGEYPSGAKLPTETTLAHLAIHLTQSPSLPKTTGLRVTPQLIERESTTPPSE
ncbi:MAG: hypothetical protein ACYTGH_07735 [Planctomycetota bacterium]